MLCRIEERIQLTNKGGSGDKVDFHFFGDGDYVAVTGWPNMKQTLTHDGWMGIAPNNKEVVLRSLDFWSLKKEKSGKTGS